MITILSKQNSVANHFIAELRDQHIQKDRMRFRRNLERLGEIFAYEISKTLTYQPTEVETPLGTAPSQKIIQPPVLATILRAGIPLHQGFLNYFDHSDCAFIAAYRHTKKSGEFEIYKEYVTTPNLDGKTLILIDPMLATGKSIVLCARDLMNEYDIAEIHVVSAIATQEGIEHVQAFVPNASIWVGDVDHELTSKAYIVPGLGDAGDLAYGQKV